MLTNDRKVQDIEIELLGADLPPSTPSERRGRAARFAGWVRRWTPRVARLMIVVLMAALGQLVGLPALLAVPLAVAVGFASRWVGPLRTRPSGRAPRGGPLAMLLAVSLVLSATSWSYTGYLAAEGAATFAVRTADWMRDHGLSPLVDQLELRLYSSHKPTNDPVATSQLPDVVTAASAFPADPLLPPTATNAPTPITRLLDGRLPGEGLWTPSSRLVNGQPVTYTTFFRPDPNFMNVVSGAVWLDPSTTTLVYSPGTRQPGGEQWAWKSGIPRDQRDHLIAAFNAGFKFEDNGSGLFTEGRTPYPLLDGQAALVITADGTVDIGTWGRDLAMTPDVVTVRQNLELLVDNGQPNPGLASSIKGEWGKRHWQVQYTRRSGIGITADGALVYVAGSNFTTETLGNALAQAGTVRAMELDIHSEQPTFNFFEPSQNATAGVIGTKLLPDMQRDADRYLNADQRDFFAVVLR